MEDVITGAAFFLLGAAATATVQAVIRRVAAKARPSAKITDITISPSDQSRTSKVPLELAFRLQMDANPVLPELDSDMTVETARQYIEKTQVALKAHEDITTHLKSILDQVHILDTTVDTDKRRLSILKKWAEYGDPINQLAKLALFNFDDEVKDVYRDPHPEEWKSGPRTVVSIDSNRNYTLYEIDVDAFVESVTKKHGPQTGQKARREVEVNNTLRRFWIHLDEEDLRWLLTRTYETAQMLDVDAKALINTLSGQLSATTPEYLRIQILITNDGSRACAIKPFAYLRIPNVIPDKKGDALIRIVSEVAAGATPAPVVIEANRAQQLTFATDAPMAQLTVNDKTGSALLDGARLRTIFDSQILQCQAAFSLVGFGHSGMSLIVSEQYRLGLPAASKDRDELAAAFDT